MGPVSMYEYELFAVVNHEGQMDTGHYTNFARYQDEVRWWPAQRLANTNIWFVSLRSGIAMMMKSMVFLDT